MPKNLKTILIVGGLVTAVIAAAVIFVIDNTIPSNPKGTVGSSAGNLNNGGYFLEIDGKVFFSNTLDNYSLYSMDPDETHAKQITSMYVDSICGAGKYVYFNLDSTKSAGPGGGFGAVAKFYGVYRCKTNGKKQECLHRELVKKLQLIDNDLYYLVTVGNNAGLNRISTKGHDPELFSKESIDPSCVSDGRIYFTGLEYDRGLHVMDPSRSAASQKLLDGTVFFPIVENDTVYYLDGSNNYRLTRNSIYGGNAVILSPDRVDCFNISPVGIFYATSQEGDRALKLIDNSGNIRTIFEGVFNSLCVTSKYLYFRSYDTGVTYHYPLDGSGPVSPFQPVK